MFVPTRSSFLRNKSEESCETIIFKRKQSDKSVCFDGGDKVIKPAKQEDKKLDMKKLRYEVIKFGSSGFEGSRKEESRVALAVALGAVPPKKKHRNYAQILAEKKAEKEKEGKEFKQTAAKHLSKKRTSKRKKVNRNRTGGLLNSYGRVKPIK